MTENPYTPPQSLDATPHDDGPVIVRQVSHGELISLTAAIAAIAYISVSSGVPSSVSPFPIVVMIPWFLGVPSPFVPMIPAAAFAVCHVRHWRRKPRAKPALGLSILLWIVSVLVPLHLLVGWSYGVQYQGFTYCVVVAMVNAAFAGIAWIAWTLARSSGNYRMQIAFGFSLFAWLTSFAFPWMGEI